MKIYTSFIATETAHAQYHPSVSWAEIARVHNERMLGHVIRVITDDHPGYQAMYAAAEGYDDRGWRFWTLTFYVALREFVEADGPGDELFLWMDADMVVNPLSDNLDWLQMRGVFAINQQEHLLTIYELFKRDFASRMIGIDPASWQQILTTIVLLERRELTKLLDSFHAGGYDLYTRDGWEKIFSGYCAQTFPHQSYFSDQVLEFAYAISGMKPETIKDVVGWVSSDPGYASRFLVHFDGATKSQLPGWLSETAEQIRMLGANL